MERSGRRRIAVDPSVADEASPAYDARELAETAHGFVAVYYSYEDVTIEEVGRLALAQAKRFVDAAVVARLRGVS